MPSISEFEKEEPTRPDVLHPVPEPAKPMIEQGNAASGDVGDCSVYVDQQDEEPAIRARNTRVVGVVGRPFVKGSKGGPGRKSLLTPELEKELFEHLAAGKTISLSCRAVGIDNSTLSKWRTAEKKGDNPELTRFFIDFSYARARGEMHMVDLALQGDSKNFSHGPSKSAQWYLERAFSHAYAPRTTMKIEEVGSLTLAAIEKVCSTKDCGCYEALLGALQELAEARDEGDSVD